MLLGTTSSYSFLLLRLVLGLTSVTDSLCCPLLFILTLLAHWNKSPLWKSLQLYNLQVLSNGFLQLNSPFSSPCTSFSVCPHLPGDGVLRAAASLVLWRGTADCCQCPEQSSSQGCIPWQFNGLACLMWAAAVLESELLMHLVIVLIRIWCSVDDLLSYFWEV